MAYIFVRFRDTLEKEGDIHYGCLVTDGDYGIRGKDLYLICFECGSVLEPDEYEVVDILEWDACEAALKKGFTENHRQ